MPHPKSRSLVLRSFLALTTCVVASFFASDARAVVLESHLGCQKAVSKATRSYAKSALKILLRCDRERMLAPGTDPCAAADVVADLGKAEAKLSEKLAKSCGSLGDGDIENPRPEGLSLEGGDVDYGLVYETGPLLVGLVRAAHGDPVAGGGAAPGDDAMDCQLELDKAVTKSLTGALKLLGTKCHDLEDKGRTVTGEVSHIGDYCHDLMESGLTDLIAKIGSKTTRCTAPAVAGLAACPALDSDRTPEAVTSCVIGHAKDSASAILAVEHGRDGPRVIGRIKGKSGSSTGTPSGGHVSLIGHDFRVIGSGVTNDNGYVSIEGAALESASLCWEESGVRSCAAEPIEIGLEPAYFEERTIDMPVVPGTSNLIVRVLRADGSPCYEASTAAELAVQGGVVITPTGSPPSGTRIPVSSDGSAFVAVPDGVQHSAHADCGTEMVSVELASPPFASPVEIHMTTPAPTGIEIVMTDDEGNPVTDPATVQPGEVVSLAGSVDDPVPMQYVWEITKGDGHFVGTPGNTRFASGPNAAWQIGSASQIHQVTLWAGNGKGGVDSIVATIGPIDVGPVLPAPCFEPPKLQKILCGTGFDVSVPEPEGGRGDFLSYKYRGSRNSPDDACLYYNIVDPECIDMDCDGVVDAGTDPLGKCKRTTLGGWWQKNGFDSLGLGSDVVSAWYLNSNDLGFGREMHCRVTSWGSVIAERPAEAPTSDARMVAALREELLESPLVEEYARLFQLYPSTVACYVTNYTTDYCFNYPTNDPQNADLAYQGQLDFVANPTVDPTHAYGTVAMEFGPVEGFGQVGSITKFFVYDGRTAAGKRLTAANLDGCGPKSVPELCMSCHGGDWPGNGVQDTQVDAIVAGLGSMSGVLAGIDANDTSSTDAGYLLRKSLIAELTRENWGFSSFLPFDPDTFQFPAAASFATQAASLRSLNQIVLYAKPKDAIRDLVKGWYSNNLASGTFAPWRPSGWNDDAFSAGDESDLHDDVYARACRVCHAAHYSFSSYNFFPPSTRICNDGAGNAGGTPTMPHAKLTYLNLWRGDFPQAPTMSTLETYYTAYEPGFVSCD